MEKDTRPLFQITEAAHACGLSRSTLLRMEEKGLLAPAYIAPDSGRRYYDNHNVARVLQIEKIKAMGLGTEEIAGYFASGGEVTDLLSMLEERLRELSRGVEELRLRAGGSGGLSIQLMTLPAVTCCTRRCEGHTIADKYNAMYDFYGQCVRRGCRLSHEPIFTISERTDYLEGRIGDTPYPFHVCVPVRHENAPKEAVTLPECRRAVGALLRRLRRRGRGIFDAGARGQGAGAEAHGLRAGAGHRGPLLRPGDRDTAVLLPHRPAGRGIRRWRFNRFSVGMPCPNKTVFCAAVNEEHVRPRKRQISLFDKRPSSVSTTRKAHRG